MPKRRRLTDAGIARLRPASREYTVWDSKVAGLGVRVRPSGSRTWIFHHKSADGVRKMSFGPALLRTVEEVRRDCLAAATGAADADDGCRGKAPLLREFVSGPWKEACYDRCKPSTQRGFSSILNSQLLPAFGSRRLDRITRVGVIRWFEQYSKTAPRNANSALTLLRLILNHALACGHVDANPARGIQRNPEAQLSRFLSREEIRRLHGVLDRYAQGSPSQAQQADIIRLLLLTGCRKNEIARLRREEVKDDRLELADSKTGPRTVMLNDPARDIVERRMAYGAGPWVFPSVKDPLRARNHGLPLWYAVRREAGIEDVRLHDLRHTVASQAAMNGIPLPVVARLLGHSNVRMTMRYAHVGDHEIEAAAERVGHIIASIIAIGKPPAMARPSQEQTFIRPTKSTMRSGVRPTRRRA